MEPSVQVFWLPKKGNSTEEYEDAYGCSEETGIFAIADGATESSFSEIWAQVLTRQFVAAPPLGAPPEPERLKQWLTPLQREWHANINWARLPWYAEEKARTGAFAALLGLKFIAPAAEPPPSIFSRLLGLFKKPPDRSPRWQALAIGDSNMFHVRDNTLIRAFPLERAEQFNSRPMLLGSNPELNNRIWNQFRFLEGDYRPGDMFLMATDALAKWFLERHEAGAKPWTTLTSLKTESDFHQFVQDLREKSQVRNDDTTLMFCQWKESPGERTN